MQNYHVAEMNCYIRQTALSEECTPQGVNTDQIYTHCSKFLCTSIHSYFFSHLLKLMPQTIAEMKNIISWDANRVSQAPQHKSPSLTPTTTTIKIIILILLQYMLCFNPRDCEMHHYGVLTLSTIRAHTDFSNLNACVLRRSVLSTSSSILSPLSRTRSEQ